MKKLFTLRFLSVLMLMLCSVTGAWADEDFVLNTAADQTPIATNNTYQSYTDATNGWKITHGGKQNNGLWLGSNKNQESTMMLSTGNFEEASGIATAIGKKTSEKYIAALIGTNEIENITKVHLTYTGIGGTTPSSAWILYSTDEGTTWNIAASTTSLEGTGTDFNFAQTISSARYAFVIYCTDYCQLKVPVFTFIKETTSGGGNNDKETATFTYSSDNYRVWVGDESQTVELPTLTKSDDIKGTIAYASNNDCVSVSNTGVVTLPSDITEKQTVVISASLTEDPKYNNATASYTLTLDKHKASTFEWQIDGVAVSNPIRIFQGAKLYTLPTLANSANMAVTYSSDNENIIAEVNGEFMVDTDVPGTATVTASGSKAGYWSNEAEFIVEIYANEEQQGGSVVAYYETFGNLSKASGFAECTGYTATSDMFTNKEIATNYTGNGKVAAASSVSSDYTNASKGSNVSHTSSAANTEEEIVTISNINISNLANLKLSFGERSAQIGSGKSHTISIKYIIDEVEYTLDAINATSNAWTFHENIALSHTGNNLTLTFSHIGSAKYDLRLDDIRIEGTSAGFQSEDIKVAVSAAEYATLYYGEKSLIVPEGVLAMTVNTGKEGLFNFIYDEGDVIPAGTGVVILADEGTHTFKTTSKQGDVDKDNMLRGSDEAALTTGGDLYYGLSLNASSELSSVGFYWMTADGAAFMNGAHKAYLAISTSTPNEAPRAFRFIEDDATCIDTVQSAEGRVQNGVYNLNGQKVSSGFRGIVIMNGKKVMK